MKGMGGEVAPEPPPPAPWASCMLYVPFVPPTYKLSHGGWVLLHRGSHGRLRRWL